MVHLQRRIPFVTQQYLVHQYGAQPVLAQLLTGLVELEQLAPPYHPRIHLALKVVSILIIRNLIAAILSTAVMNSGIVNSWHRIKMILCQDTGVIYETEFLPSIEFRSDINCSSSSQEQVE